MTYSLISSVNALVVILASSTHLDDAEIIATQMLDVMRNAKALNQSFVQAVVGISGVYRLLKGTATSQDDFNVFEYHNHISLLLYTLITAGFTMK